MNTNNIAHGLRITSSSERKPDIVDTQSTVVNVDALVLEAYEQYEKRKSMFDQRINKEQSISEACDNYDGVDYYLSYGSVSAPLRPQQINDLLLLIMRSTPDADSRIIGIFISAMMQNSYNDLGEDKFTLETQDKKIDYIGYNLRGREDKRITLNINGQIGDFAAKESHHINLDIKEDTAGDIGRHSHDNFFKMNVSNFTSLGDYIKDSTFEIETQNAKTYSINTLDQTLKTFYAVSRDTVRCTFQTHDKETYKKLKNQVSYQSIFHELTGKRNKVVLLK